MNRSILYVLLLIGAGLLCFTLFNKKDRISFPKEEANFEVKQLKKIDRIILTANDGRQVELKKHNKTTWTLNDSLKARPDWVEFLFDAFEHQTPSAPVPTPQHDMVVKSLAGDHVHCQIFKKDERLHNFFVSRMPGTGNITYMLNIKDNGENAERPYMVKYGLGNTFLGVRYEPTIEDWRSKRMLHFPAKERSFISVNFPDSAQHNFLLEGSFDQAESLKLKPQSNADPKKIQEYISAFEELYCTGFENSYTLIDTFLKSFTPLAIIQSGNTNGDKEELAIYYRPVYSGTKKVITINGNDFDGDYFYGWWNKKDFIVLSKHTLFKMLRSHKDFFK